MQSREGVAGRAERLDGAGKRIEGEGWRVAGKIAPTVSPREIHLWNAWKTGGVEEGNDGVKK